MFDMPTTQIFGIIASRVVATLPVPHSILEEVSMDFIVKLPKSQGYDAVLVVVDRLSKYWHFLPLKHPYSTRTVAEVFVKEVIRLTIHC